MVYMLYTYPEIQEKFGTVRVYFHLRMNVWFPYHTIILFPCSFWIRTEFETFPKSVVSSVKILITLDSPQWKESRKFPKELYSGIPCHKVPVGIGPIFRSSFEPWMNFLDFDFFSARTNCIHMLPNYEVSRLSGNMKNLW